MNPVRSIKNQYPGINAHLHSLLQSEGGWSSFHGNHIADLARLMQTQLRHMGYEAVNETSLQIRRDNVIIGYPVSDVTIYDSDRARSAGRPAPHSPVAPDKIMPIPILLDLAPTDMVEYRAVGIYEVVPVGEGRGDPVVWVEVLSPSNKPGGRNFDTYDSKRTTLLQSGVVFVELDYLHHYPPTFPALSAYPPDEVTPDTESHPYRIAVVVPRPNFIDGKAYIRQFNVDDPLPTMTIPLNADDVLDFDFGAPYAKTFEEMFYGDKVDYSQLPRQFDRYSPADQTRIANRMLAVLSAAQTGPDLESGAPFEVEALPLEEALAQFERLKEN